MNYMSVSRIRRGVLVSEEKDKSDFRSGEFNGRFGGIFTPTPSSQAGRDGYAAGLIRKQNDELKRLLEESAREKAEASERKDREEERARDRRQREAEEEEREQEWRYEQQARKERWRDETLLGPGSLAEKISLGIAKRIDRDAYWFARNELESYARQLGRSSFVRECITQLTFLPERDESPEPRAPPEVHRLAVELAKVRAGLLLQGQFLPFQNNAEGVEEVESLWDGRTETYRFFDVTPEMRCEKWTNVEGWMRLDAPFLTLEYDDHDYCMGYYYQCDPIELGERISTYEGDEVWTQRLDQLMEAIVACDQIGLWGINPRWMKWRSWDGDVASSPTQYGEYIREPQGAVEFLMSHRHLLLRAMKHGAARVIADMHSASDLHIEAVVDGGRTYADLSIWLNGESLEPISVGEFGAMDSWIRHSGSMSEDAEKCVGLYGELRELIVKSALRAKGVPRGERPYVRIALSLNEFEGRWKRLCASERDDGPMCLQLRSKAASILSRLNVFKPWLDVQSSLPLSLIGFFVVTLFMWVMSGSVLLGAIVGLSVVLLGLLINAVKKSALGGNPVHERYALGLLDRWASHQVVRQSVH